MNLLRRLAGLFGGRPGGGSERMLTIYVLSRRCNEPLMGQVDLFNELSQAEESEYSYYSRKVLHTSGERRCFDQVEVQLWFNQSKQLAHHEVAGGRWLDAAEYEAELARFNAPPESEGEAPTSDHPPAAGSPAGELSTGEHEQRKSDHA